jgi:hypothetical protein
MSFEKIAEQKILEAMSEGEFDDLPGMGRPLQGLAGYFATPEDVRVGYSILKSSGFVPQEIELLKEIAALEARRREGDPTEQARIGGEIQRVRLKYDLLVEAYRKGRSRH